MHKAYMRRGHGVAVLGVVEPRRVELVPWRHGGTAGASLCLGRYFDSLP